MRIGLLLDTLMNGYQSQLLLGAHEECVRQGVDLLCFVGGPVLDSQKDGPLFNLISARDIDAMVIAGGCLFSGKAEENQANFLARFPSIPVVSVGLSSLGTPSVLVDNRRGIRDMVGHLARFHGRKRLAFLRVNCPEGIERFAGYQQGLADAGLPFFESLVFDGVFSFASGQEIAKRLRHVDFDAVVASNDWQAIGLMEALAEMRILVPQEILVTGFDDIDEANFALPSLSTVRQPIFDLARSAVRLAIEKLRGATVPPRTVVPAELCLRASCGCQNHSIEAPVPGKVSFTQGELELLHHQETLVEILLSRATLLGLGDGRHDAVSLVQALMIDIQDPKSDQFVSALDVFLRKQPSTRPLAPWHQVLCALRHTCMHYLEPGHFQLGRFIDRFEHAHMVVSSIAEYRQGTRRIRAERLRHFLVRGARLWREAIANGRVGQAMREHLDVLGIPALVAAVVDGPLRSDGDARLLLFHDAHHTSSSPSLARVFRAGQIIPRSEAPFRRLSLVVFPLYAGNGYCALEFGPTDTFVLEGTLEQIANACQVLAAAPG